MRRSATALAVMIVSLSAGARAQSRDATARCRAACARYAVDPRSQASTCAPCLLHPDDPAAWMERLKSPPKGAQQDAEWTVRWGALRLEARGTKKNAQQRLAAWVARSAGAERELACVTALQVAGALGQRLGDFLAAAKTGEPSAAGACAVLEPRLVTAVEPALFSIDPVERRETVRGLAKGLGQKPAQVLMRAMKTRPEAFDELVADDLARLAEDGDEPAGRALLTAATAADTEQVNRLLAVYSKRRDELRAGLSAASLDERRMTVHRLAALAPLSAPDLAPSLEDPSGSVRLAAAKGLAAGEGRTLAEAAEARLSGAEPARLEQQLSWLGLLADASAPGCADVALRAWERVDAAARLRGAALAVAAGCDWSRAEAAVASAAASSDRTERSAAAWAAAKAPTNAKSIALSLDALASDDPPTLAAGLAGAARHRQKAQAGRAASLSAHADPAVRAEALKALAVLDAGQARLKAMSALERDGDADVRKAAAQALSVVGGPQALGALDRAARNDPDPGVKFVAADSLRRLGTGSPLP